MEAFRVKTAGPKYKIKKLEIMENKHLKIFILVLAVSIIVPQVVLAAWWNPFSWGVWNKIFKKQEQKQEQTACTMDAKQCSDGSFVGRKGPKCDFEACPGDNAGKCESDKDCPVINCIKAPCPQNKCINNRCQAGLFWDVIYPLYSGVNWETVGSKKNTVPVSNIALEGYGVKGQAKISSNTDAGKFFAYYDVKLKSAGWTIENNFSADGVGGSQVGYKKDSDYIVLSYKITPGKIISRKNEPLQWTCPCQVQYDIFAGSAVNKTSVVGGDKDKHGCIGSAGYSWCEVKQKCLRSWEENCEVK